MRPEYFVVAAIAFTFAVLLDWYSYQAVRAAFFGRISDSRLRVLRYLHFGSSWVYLLVLASSPLWLPPRVGSAVVDRIEIASWLFLGVILLYIPRLVVVVVLMGEDALRGVRYGVAWGVRQLRLSLPAPAQTSTVDPSSSSPADTIATDPVPNASPSEAPRGLTRSEFLSQLALGIAAIPFGVTVYGVASGRHNFQVLTRKVPIRGLPDAFDGLRVLQVSDLHLGSFGGEKMLRQAVRLINDQAPDVILHTGDMVNDVADEMKPYLHVLRELRAPLGKFAVLGNHDYGGYVRWDSPEQQVANFDQLLRQFDQAEFKLLRNEHFLVQKNGQTLPIVGVENWGLPPFPQLGDLYLATQGLPADAPKILLSHDPSHWDAHALVHPQHFSLTLAGHTHGMQLGVELGDWRWSPVEMKYPRWADLYTEGDQHLYVNRGLGCLGYPGRVGILPEITVLVLEKA